MTAAELKAKRHSLGLSAAGLAAALKMKGGKQAGRTVRRWESGDQEIPGYVEVYFEQLEQIASGQDPQISQGGKSQAQSPEGDL